MVLSFAPSVQLAFMSFYASEVHHFFGHWPRAMSEDTSGMYLARLCVMSDQGWEILGACCVLWILLLAFLIGRRDFRVSPCAAIFALGIGGVVLFLITNPHGFVNWYID